MSTLFYKSLDEHDEAYKNGTFEEYKAEGLRRANDFDVEVAINVIKTHATSKEELEQICHKLLKDFGTTKDDGNLPDPANW